MTFEYAIRNIAAGRAVKRPTMRGYFAKSVEGLDEEQIAAGQYAIVCVEADGKKTVFPMNGMKVEVGEGKAQEPKLSVNAEFFAAIIESDWIEAPVEDFETARIGAGRW